MILLLTLVALAVLGFAVFYRSPGATPFTTSPTATNEARLRRYERLTGALQEDESMARRRALGYRVIAYQMDREMALERQRRRRSRPNLQLIAN